ncbi:hypothetical protein NO932_08685 [Pelagibacterium sp. 26DY04]|uniref:hypothetical protein n=1 Tax=Pelagibacterium sp. 26DY04 TaxID=2967130 RepID=UPI0028152DAA|nr:hypothetical protein [Pelagibacterium sp. 26DY04]WMT88665.1 hypothetical protein NO932_08685 [Pelagibacterium sp. 26DY04]
MKITNLRPLRDAGVLAYFDVRLSPEVELLDWHLKRSRSGQLRTFPPQTRDTRGSAARVAPEVYDQITAQAVEIYEGQVAGHDRSAD